MGSSKDVRFYSIKEEVRILGLDDGHFDFRKDKKALVVGVVFRGGRFLDGILRTEVSVDGTDSTRKIIRLVNGSKFKDIRVIMLDGLGFAGFNLVDIDKLFEKTGLPVIVVVRRMPDFAAIEDAIKKLAHRRFCRRCVAIAGRPEKVEVAQGRHIYIQYRGISLEDAKKIVSLSCTRSLIPEPIRVAHLIASGIVLGESRRGA